MNTQLNITESEEFNLLFKKTIQITREILSSKHPNRGNNRVVYCTKEENNYLIDWHIWSVWAPGEVHLSLRREKKFNGITVEIELLSSMSLERGT